MRKTDIEYGVLSLVAPKKVTDKEPTDLIFLCYHNECGWFHLEKYNAIDNCCHRYWIIESRVF